MKTKFYVSEKYPGLSDFIKTLPQNFDNVGELIYSGRNEVRAVEIDGLMLAIKYFKRLTLANRFIYATIRKSKARRAYEYSDWLLAKGITTPESVAYVDCYRHSMLCKSFYVSTYTNYKPVKDLFALSIAASEEGLKAFARFTWQLHQKGVFHYDYTTSNILYSTNGPKYDFALIDNNRMKISKYSFRRGIKTLNRLAIPVEEMGIVAAEYARISGVNDLKMLNAMVSVRLLNRLRTVMKKWLKTPLKYFMY